MAADYTVESYGFIGAMYNQIFVFRNKADFELVLNANENMEALVGKDEFTSKLFPGVYIAGIRAS